MRYQELLEYINIEKTKDQFGKQLTTRLENDRTTDLHPDQAIDYIANNVDPSVNQKYSLWILRTYLKDGIRYFEDMSKTSHYLKIFEKHINKMPIKDIHQFKNISDLADMVLPFENTKTGKEIKRGMEQEFLTNHEVTIIHNSTDLKIVTPHSEEASCYYGKGTAATESENYFDGYNTLLIKNAIENSLYTFKMNNSWMSRIIRYH